MNRWYDFFLVFYRATPLTHTSYLSGLDFRRHPRRNHSSTDGIRRSNNLSVSSYSFNLFGFIQRRLVCCQTWLFYSERLLYVQVEGWWT